MTDDNDDVWLPVIGKSLALLALHRAELGNSDLIEKAEFLEGLGIPRAEVATMLGTSAESLRVMFSRKGKGGKGRRGSKKKG